MLLMRHGAIASQGGEPWTPAALTLTRWWTMESATLFDATSGGSTPAADGAVLRIEDVSGNARHATQSNSTLAAIRKVASLNGRDGIRFDGSNDIYTSTGSSYAALWAIAVCRFDQAGSKVFAGLYTGADSQLILDSTGNSLFTSTGFTVRRDGNVTTAFTKQQPMIWFCGRGGSSTSLRTFGAEHNAPTGRYWIGECWELIEGNTALSTDDIERLEGYLAHRFDRLADLPGGHPYKANPPTL